MIRGTRVTIKDVEFCRKLIREYEDLSRQQHNKADNTDNPQSKGGYRSQASQNSSNAERMKGNLAAQLDWLKANDPKAYVEAMEQ